jgi:PAS domain S-box-containing protein
LEYYLGLDKEPFVTYGANTAPESILYRAVAALDSGDALYSALDSLPAPIYVTDTDGLIIYFNPACIDFAGRKPQVGLDRWCVTWKLFTDEGAFLPHAECPMATAIKTARPVRGVSAVAERPDGTRVTFMPYPTPLFAPDGSLRSAVNMLIDVTEKRQSAALREQAARCRRLMRSIANRDTVETLALLAEEYETKALLLDAGKSP